MPNRISDNGEARRKHDTAQDIFLAAYVETGTILGAATATPSVNQGGKNLTPETVWAWQKHDPVFRQRLIEARKLHAAKLYAIAMERVTTPTGNRGSDWQLTRMLEWADPQMYGPKGVEADSAPSDLAKLMFAEAKRILTTLSDGSTKVEESVSIKRLE